MVLYSWTNGSRNSRKSNGLNKVATENNEKCLTKNVARDYFEKNMDYLKHFFPKQKKHDTHINSSFLI